MLFARFFILSLFVVIVQSIGLCREDHKCLKEPEKPGSICKCWSTCSPVVDARRCDNANHEYSGYDKEMIGGSDILCSYMPFVRNARDLCVWYYDPEDILSKVEQQEENEIKLLQQGLRTQNN